jgi:hypothetical protein
MARGFVYLAVVRHWFFQRAAAALGLRLVWERARADVFRYEGGVLAEPIARSLDLDNNGVVKQAIKQCCGDDGITKNLAPFGEAAVRSEGWTAT